MWKKSSNTMTYVEAQKRKFGTGKDGVLAIDHATAVGFMFRMSRDPTKFNLRYDGFFVDYDLIPLLIQQHYPSAVQASTRTGGKNHQEALQSLLDAAEAACDADIVQNYIRGKQRWDLLPVSAALNLRVTTIAGGSIGFAGFPEWLGKNSNRSKRNRMVNEMSIHMRQFCSISPKSLRLDLFDPLRDALLQPLLMKQKGGVPETLKLMDEYGLSRDDVFDTLQEVVFPQASNEFDKISSITKREFTRLYNLSSHKSQGIARENAIVGLKKKKSKKKGADDSENDNESDDDDIMALAQKKNAKSKKGKGKSKRKKR